ILESGDVARIGAINPDIKLIFMIRNPIERAWSAVRFHLYKGAIINLESADEVISLLQHPAMSLRGDYERTIETYLTTFDSSQILVCFYDAIKNNPVGLMSDITKFLAIEPYGETVITNKVPVNPSPAHTIPQKVSNFLYETYAPMINRMAESFGSYSTIWNSEGSPGDVKSKKNQVIDMSICKPTIIL
ncbi:MAG: sulfotransferase domain-containing protein, partial [Candidatus Marinimicrobia bacterium]|nr:sulfotransferase domain-containing protein [Candidatus Neomarinimicrobiota bacterium]